MPLSDKSRPSYDKENHDKTSGGRIHQPSEKWWQLVGDQHEAAQCCDTKAQKECTHKHLHQLASIGSENKGMQDGDDNEQGMVDEDNDENLSSDMPFSSHSVPTRVSSGTKQPLTFHHKKIPKTPHILATAMEALQALMASDCEVDDEFYCSPSASFEVESTKQKKSKDKCMEANMCKPDAAKNTTECVGPKRQCEIGPKDKEPISVKAQKLIEHEGNCAIGSLLGKGTSTYWHEPGVNPRLIKTHKWSGIFLVCGELKTKLHPFVEVVFGFHSSQSKSAIKKNWTLVEALKEGTNFAFKGIMFPEHFKPFPYPTLTIVLTAIECCIDEWVTGKQGDISFTTQEYRSVYKAYLKCLEEFDSATKDVCVLPAICARIYEAGHVHSGASAITAESQCKVSAHIITTAIQEHQEGSTTDEESN
ncbi:hypothetical protein EDC04DRAFT_2603191 [Pisolithus marmoratus]|nr:hypothetical protein EDC04DRAFT_2603191 [Pisolithus marmoratus]